MIQVTTCSADRRFYPAVQVYFGHERVLNEVRDRDELKKGFHSRRVNSCVTNYDQSRAETDSGPDHMSRAGPVSLAGPVYPGDFQPGVTSGERARARTKFSINGFGRKLLFLKWRKV